METIRDVRESVENFLINTIPSPTHWLLIGSVAIAAILIAVVVLVRSRPVEMTYSAARESQPASRAVSVRTHTAARPAAKLAVHIAGQVQNPQVYYLASGSRVVDAIKAAGGATAGADINTLNLAAKIADGERLYVPAKGEQIAGSEGTGVVADSSGLIDINQASSADLEKLDGIGPTLAERIVKFRTKVGRFTRLDQLQDVDGIGPKKLSAIKGQVRVR